MSARETYGYGLVTGFFMHTNGIDAAGSTIGIDQYDNTRFEHAYAGWRSGDLFSSLGKGVKERS